MSEKILYFEGAGMSDAPTSKATVGNCRIRTAFHLDDGQAVYLELTGSERTKYSSPEVYKWPYTGFVSFCFYITDEAPNDDENRHSIYFRNQRTFEYTEAEILKLVNRLGASFDGVKVLPDLGGYRVFREDCTREAGTGRMNYGDEFPYDPEMIARREAVYDRVYQMEKEELQADWNARGECYVHLPDRVAHPNFSLWVDEKDPGMLHLLRHFNCLNKHWTIRTDTGDTLDDWMATMTEAKLGRYGC